MARHRINENGHMMWFDSDEEYKEYLKSKKGGYGCIWISIIILILGGAVSTCLGGKDDKDSPKNMDTITVSAQKKVKKSTKKKEKKNKTIQETVTVQSNESSIESNVHNISTTQEVKNNSTYEELKTMESNNDIPDIEIKEKKSDYNNIYDNNEP